MDYADLIDLDRYPIDRPGPALEAVLSHAHAALANDGCAVLEGFLTAQGVACLVDEACGVAGKAHKSFSRSNPYFTEDNPALPTADPRRRFFDRSNAFISADNFRPEGALRAVYGAPGFDAFVQACLKEDRFFRYADPLADAIVNMAEAGEGFPWHFDTNNFTVTLAIQNAEEGGEFEYVPAIRAETENFGEVARVLDGESDKVRSLRLKPGDLQLFRGRYSLHRVAPLKGRRPRFVGILSYVEEPGMVGAPERVRQLYGKVLPVHYERAGRRVDALID